jgi:hypothetical protein
MNKLSEKLYPDVFHESKIMSEARQQADVVAILNKRWARGVCSRLMFRVSHHQPDLAHLDEELTDILQWKRGVLLTSDAGNSTFDPSVSTRCIGAGQGRGS